MSAPALRIVGSTVLTPHGAAAVDLAVVDGRLVVDPPRPGAQGARILDASGLVVSAGWIDLQCNGANGFDVTSEPERLWDVARALPRYGVTAFLPTVVTAPAATVTAALDALRRGPPPGWRGAVPLGLHIEGPMLNPARRGAHAAHLLREPDPALVDGWRWDAGVALVTLAPELPRALDVVRRLVEAGVVVSAGHTDATADQLVAGLGAGITYVTHLFNAMSPLAHRAPGVVGAVLAHERIVAGVIADGIHVHPTAIAAAWRALGPHRLNLVTDAVAALGLGAGPTRLGSMDVTVGVEGVRLADGTLAGAALGLDGAVRNLLAYTGCTISEAAATVTSTPASVLRLADRGAIDDGRRADLVVLTPELDVVATIVAGEVVFAAQDLRWRS